MEASGARVAGALGGSAVAWDPAELIPTSANSVALDPELVLGRSHPTSTPQGPLSTPRRIAPSG